MRNLYQRLDFKAGILAFFLVGIIVMTETFFSWQYNQEQAVKEFARNNNSLTSTAANSMSFPLWDFDIDIVEEMVEALVLNPSVVSASVTEKNGELLAYKGANDAAVKAEVLTKSAAILSPNGTELGTLTIQFSLQGILKESQRQLVFAALMALATSMLVFAVIAWIIRWIVQPVQALENSVRTYDGSKRLEDIPGLNRKDEIGALAGGFEDMANQIHENMATLETRVNERTQELKEAVDKASAANEAKSSFLANMSHEIRTPMNGVLGMAQVLQGTELNDRQKTFVDTIYESGFALVTIINDILDYSKIEAGKVELEPIDFHLASAVEDVATLLGVAARDKNLDLLVRVQPDLPNTFVGDIGRIRQILTNLVGNAIKFTTEGSVLVDVSGVRNGDRFDLKFLVRDTGIGLKPEKLDVIFDEFNQAENSTTRKYGGTGLGLSITKSLIEAMRGTIHVESEFGKGADFIVQISLPAADIQSEETVLLKGEGQYVLVVDDNTVNRDILKEALENWSLQPVFADSAKKALKILHQAKEKQVVISLILTDYNMPEYDGIDFVRAVRRMKGVSETPIIALSSTHSEDVVNKFKSFGVVEVFTKPVRLPHLNQSVYDVISNQNIEALKTIASEHATMKTDVVAQVSVPPVSASQPAIIQKVEIEKPTSPPARPRFLIADDNETNRVVLGYMVDQTKFDVDFANDGLEAYEKAQTHNYAIIFMDISMPKMDGVESMKSIRAFENKNNRPQAPIIAVTAHAMSGDRDEMLRSGMSDYMAKPVDQDQLNATIEKWLSANVSDRSLKVAS